MRSIMLPFAIVGSLGFAANALAEIPMHRVYHHHYQHMHSGAHLGHRQACIGQGSGTAHRSCGTHTGGPSGGLH